ncbi:MAG TPA: ABC transporter ATP-binding protein [Granulicella sp.]|jgi:ABC-2 type transport system ATP-binding protein
MSAAIETHLLTKQYRRTVALDRVTLEIPERAVYALVGANGAGKTTLIRLLMNIFPPSAGSAIVLGVASGEVSGHVFERIAYVSENQEMPDALTVGGLLDYVRPFYPQWDRELEGQLVRQFDLPLDRKLKHLSRGMRMKAALASVLAYRPALIVLDEPFSGLEPLVRDELIESLKEQSGQTTILLSSHDMSEVESFATHVGFLEKGRLLFSERLSALVDRFREVEVTMSGTANVTIPSGAPVTWLNAQCSESAVRFVDSQFSGETSAALTTLFPDAEKISIQPMTLRSIVVAIARSGRSQKSKIAGEREAA